ncbi:hypothetical protein GWI33_003429 [Rhynchophorus ferrugineus]|uniref:Uncharacterized protein n=1 Tax=Rhynchophorus ferrugineus TaxID=354439 RepID=A0A834J0D2_RHYFE|nr:hypothetical protein GWI33_003429 [Rhynchophorus ferrugineus]
MTHYWWMHWFWITLSLYELILVAFGHTLLTTLNSIPTTDIPTTQLDDIDADTAIKNVTSILPKVLNSLAKNSSIYGKTTKPRQFTRKLDIPPLQSPPENNSTDILKQTSTDIAVINQNETVSDMNSTGYIFEELSFNQSFIQSDSIGVEEGEFDLDNSTGNLSAAGITGITLGCVVVVGIICGVSFFIYQNQGFNRPQVLNDRCSNPDSSGYIDDASDNSEEMYSLDNDSFLNSLEAMTIQNYWTDTVKHTKL